MGTPPLLMEMDVGTTYPKATEIHKCVYIHIHMFVCICIHMHSKESAFLN
jgi:hypothetical protein